MFKVLNSRFTIEIIKWASSNGEIAENKIKKVLFKNRALWLGENFFISARTFCGSLMYGKEQVGRFVNNIKDYYGDNFTREYYREFQNSVEKLIAITEVDINKKYHKENEEAYIRLTLIPSFSGFTINSGMELYVQLYAQTLPRTEKSRFAKIKIRNYSVMPFGKSGQYQNQISDLHFNRKRKIEEIIYVNELGDILEASTSNIIVVNRKDKIFYVPGKSEKIYSGLISEKLKELLRELGYDEMSCEFNHLELGEDHELILTNSVKLITGVFIDPEKPSDEAFVTYLNSELLKQYKEI